jgi:hypothetical protein
MMDGVVFEQRLARAVTDFDSRIRDVEFTRSYTADVDVCFDSVLVVGILVGRRWRTYSMRIFIDDMRAMAAGKFSAFEVFASRLRQLLRDNGYGLPAFRIGTRSPRRLRR